MDNNWIIENLNNALNTWNDKLGEIWQIVSQSPESFKGGAVWNMVVNIHGGLKAIGYALIVLFFVIGVMKSCSNLSEIKRPEQALKLFIRFALAKGVVSYGLEIMMAAFNIAQGMVSTIMATAGFGDAQQTVLPSEIVTAINNCDFLNSIPLWVVTLIGGIGITVLRYVMIMSVYGRFCKIYMYTAIAPIPLANFAGEGNSAVGKSFLKSCTAVCLESAIIVLACVIFLAFASSVPQVHYSASAVTMVWPYISQTLFNMIVIVGCVKMNDRVSKEMFGL